MSSSKSPQSILKRLRWIVAVVILTILVWLGMRPKPVEVDLATISRGPIEVTVDEDGETRIRDPYLISAPLAGRLVRVELEPGDPIARNQVIAAIDPGEPGLLDARRQAESEARLKAAEAALRRSESQLEIAKAEAEKAARYVERDRERLAKGNISAPTLADTEHALRIARGNETAAQSALEVARFEMEQAEAALLHSRTLADDGIEGGRQFEIRSPIDGVVLRRFQESSTMLPAAEGILEVGNPNDLEIRIDVLSEDAVKIRPGQSVRLENWGGPDALHAHIRRVDPSAFTKVSALGVDEQRVWVYADFVDPDGDSEDRLNPELQTGRSLLGDGFRVEARIVVWKKEDVIKAPSGALFRNEKTNDWAVYRVRDGRAELVPVVRGQDNGIEAEIEEGLQEADEVILHPGNRIEDGVAVQARES
jgi:HlyD family secretion protein